MNHVNYVIEISTGNIHFVNVDHTRYSVFVSLTPNGLRLGLNATLCAHNGYGTVKNTQGTLYLYGKVNVAGGINDIDSVTLPEAGGSSGGNGNTALLFLFHPVHRSRAFVSLTNLMRFTGVIQDTLSSGGLAGVNMSHDTDISRFYKRSTSRHIRFPFLL
jgi:hypothetical protein